MIVNVISDLNFHLISITMFIGFVHWMRWWTRLVHLCPTDDGFETDFS